MLKNLANKCHIFVDIDPKYSPPLYTIKKQFYHVGIAQKSEHFSFDLIQYRVKVANAVKVRNYWIFLVAQHEMSADYGGNKSYYSDQNESVRSPLGKFPVLQVR